MFFISKQKHLGKGPEIAPLLEAWLPVLRANLERRLPLPPAASGGAPESAAGRPPSLRSCFNPSLYLLVPTSAAAPMVPQPRLCLPWAPWGPTGAPTCGPTSRLHHPSTIVRQVPRVPDCPAPGWDRGRATAWLPSLALTESPQHLVPHHPTQGDTSPAGPWHWVFCKDWQRNLFRKHQVFTLLLCTLATVIPWRMKDF